MVVLVLAGCAGADDDGPDGNADLEGLPDAFPDGVTFPYDAEIAEDDSTGDGSEVHLTVVSDTPVETWIGHFEEELPETVEGEKEYQAESEARWALLDVEHDEASLWLWEDPAPDTATTIEIELRD